MFCSLLRAEKALDNFGNSYQASSVNSLTQFAVNVSAESSHAYFCVSGWVGHQEKNKKRTRNLNVL